MVLDLLTIAGLPTAVGAAEAVYRQRVLDEEAESSERRAPFRLNSYYDAQSKKRGEVHNAIVVLRDGKLWLWPKDANTGLPEPRPNSFEAPHPFTGFYLPFPTKHLPNRPIPVPPVLGLVSTIPPDASHSLSPRSKQPKPKLNWIYVDKDTRELKYGARVNAREHVIGPWDWTEDKDGLTLNDEELLVVVEEKKGGYGWAVYWDPNDDRLKDLEVGKTKRVLRCSLERRSVEKSARIVVE
ncbi:hypothetical protein CC78DRAFT_558454 [Lojkania enalia]|uniref:Uncharacterized protein n=1 Tax=Lojkania enalia TaxID=147567 RepID=A0A9P4N954_9PLEO|nr:hypothetical protein CC78DRAFT_558454 [Didymosphaeria enalia]